MMRMKSLLLLTVVALGYTMSVQAAVNVVHNTTSTEAVCDASNIDSDADNVFAEPVFNNKPDKLARCRCILTCGKVAGKCIEKCDPKLSLDDYTICVNKCTSDQKTCNENCKKL